MKRLDNKSKSNILNYSFIGILFSCSLTSMLNSGCIANEVSKFTTEADTAQVSPCNLSDKLDLEKEFKDQTGSVYAIRDIGVNRNTVYIIKSDYHRDVLPCNLPKAYQRDSLRIVFSGRAYQMNNPYIDIMGLPFELSRISEAKIKID